MRFLEFYENNLPLVRNTDALPPGGQWGTNNRNSFFYKRHDFLIITYFGMTGSGS